jgi:hypothetical protein
MVHMGGCSSPFLHDAHCNRGNGTTRDEQPLIDPGRSSIERSETTQCFGRCPTDTIVPRTSPQKLGRFEVEDLASCGPG